MPDHAISLLLGAGFSVPAGYPTARQLNQGFLGLRADQFSVHTDGSAGFHKGKTGPNNWMSDEERLFVVRLVQHYANRVVTPEQFHYEEFYDWYKSLLRRKISDPGAEALATGPHLRFGDQMVRFDHTFNQLLAAPLTRWYPEVDLSGGPPEHARFLKLMDWLVGEFPAVHVHTLNHDLHFEYLTHTDAMRDRFSDGFVELGSPYYGVIRQPVDGEGGSGSISHRVRLRYFADDYDARVNLYKLHGSVNHYLYRDGGPTTIKWRPGVELTRLKKEVQDANGQLCYDEDPSNYYPDFLSGTLYKTFLYGATPYYRTMIARLQHNLEQSRTLVVIGYSFGDRVINELVERHLCSRPDTGVVVIDITEPVNISDLIASRSRYEGGGVSSFALGAVARHISSFG